MSKSKYKLTRKVVVYEEVSFVAESDLDVYVVEEMADEMEWEKSEPDYQDLDIIEKYIPEPEDYSNAWWNDGTI